MRRAIGRKRKGGLVLALVLLACGTPPPARTSAAPAASAASAASAGAPAAARSPISPVAVEQELERIAAGPAGDRFWPGFDPLAIPLVLYDGQATWLFRHPHPPPELGPGQGGARIADGRPESLRANIGGEIGAEIGGVPTATLILSGVSGARSARDWAALAVHEAFHVFAREHHPDWVGDEMALFVYPVEAREPLTLRREEAQALRRALAAEDVAGTACWADLAVRLRGGRFALLPPEAVAYERGTELNEGLATYVEGLARGETRMELPADDFPAEQVRDRAYAVGRAEAILLDRLDSTWKERLDRSGEGQPGSLDERLAATVATVATAGRSEPRSCNLSSGETAAAARRAGEDLERLTRERQSARAAFLGRPGWSVVVTAGMAGSEPLWPRKIDPSNVLSLGGGEVLHRRWLKLGNADAEFEVLDREALTEAVGPHPLREGVRLLTVTGLAEKPEVHERAGWVRLDVPGFTAKLKSATIEVSHHELRIQLKGAPAPPRPPAAAAAPHREPGRPTSTG